MKKLVAALVIMFSLLVLSPQAFTCGPVITGGQADIPYWWYQWDASNDYCITMFIVANRSGKSVDATLSLRYDDGTPVTLNIVKNDGNYYSAANATVTVPAYGQEVFSLTGVTQASTIRGAGTLSWEFTDQSTCNYCKPLSAVVERRDFHVFGSGPMKQMSTYQLMVNGDTWF